MGINLLAWRENRDAKRKKHMGREILLCLMCVFLGLFFTHIYHAHIFERQKKEISSFESVIKEMEKKYAGAILQQKQSEEENKKLQHVQNKIAEFHLFLSAIFHFSDAMPNGVYLTEILKKGEVLHFFGKSSSHAIWTKFLDAVKKQKDLQHIQIETTSVEEEENGVHFEIQLSKPHA